MVISSGGGQAGFTVTLTQNAVIIPPGGTDSIDVTASSNGTYSGRVALRAENAPAGTSFKFNSRRVKVKPDFPGVSRLTITVSRDAQPGTYLVRIVGRDTKTGEESSTILRLIILSCPDPRL